jgi:hypothetical protein
MPTARRSAPTAEKSVSPDKTRSETVSADFMPGSEGYDGHNSGKGNVPDFPVEKQDLPMTVTEAGR